MVILSNMIAHVSKISSSQPITDLKLCTFWPLARFFFLENSVRVTLLKMCISSFSYILQGLPNDLRIKLKLFLESKIPWQTLPLHFMALGSGYSLSSTDTGLFQFHKFTNSFKPEGLYIYYLSVVNILPLFTPNFS